MVFDKKLIEKRFSRQLGNYSLLASVQKSVCQRLSFQIKNIIPNIEVTNALEVGIGTGFLTSALLEMMPSARWTLNDISRETLSHIEPYIQGKNVDFMWGDAEVLPFPEGLDFIATSSTVQWFDDLELFIKKCAKASRKGAILALTTFGKNNFSQIKATTGESLNYLDINELTSILTSCGYEVLSQDCYTESLEFDSPTEVLKHIHQTGVNALKSEPWTRTKLQSFTQSYRALCGDRIILSYEPIILVARLLD